VTFISLYGRIAQSEALKYDASLQLIELGETFTICATDNGKVFSWGSNDFFQLGRNTNELEENEKSSVALIKLEIPEHSQIQKVFFLNSFEFYRFFSR